MISSYDYLVKKLSTSITITTTIVVNLTGIYMYFFSKTKALELVHIYVGFIFVAACVLHNIKNWRPTKAYFKKKSFYVVTLLTILVSLGSYYSVEQTGFSPKMVIGKILNSDVQTVSLLYKVNPDTIFNKMDSDGLIYNKSDNLGLIGKKNKKSFTDLLQYFN